MDDTRSKPTMDSATDGRSIPPGIRKLASLQGEKCFALARYLDQRIELLQSPRFHQLNWLSEMLELLPLFTSWDERANKPILLDDLQSFPHLQRYAPMFRRLAQAVDDGTIQLLESDAHRRSAQGQDIAVALLPWDSPSPHKPGSELK